MLYLPSKKFIFIIIIALALGGLFWFIRVKQPPTKKNNNTAYTKTALNRPNQNLDKDSDSDGLKDWEEILWKTDMNNPDSDGDGTKDGEEINLGRDPLKPGPDDKFENAQNLKPEDKNKELTLTQDIGRNFLMQYLTVKGKENLAPEQKNIIINSMLDKISGKETLTKYSLKNIRVSSDNSKENIKNYINKLGAVFQNFQDIKKSELAVLIEILNKENETDLQKIEELRNNREVYEKSAKEILELRAPSNYQNIHLGIINSFAATAEIVSKMELIYNDPAQSIIALKDYLAETKIIVQIFKDFKGQLEKDKPQILPDEDGYIFVKDYFSKI